MSKLLINEPPMVFQPSLATVIGVEEAVILQHIHYLLKDKSNGKTIKGERWIYNTYEEWISRWFPWMSVITLKRKIRKLEKMELLESCQPEGGISRKKYYRINSTTLKALEDDDRLQK